MDLLIKNELAEIIITIIEDDLPGIEEQIRACMAGNYKYIDFEDIDGTKHFFTMEYLKKSHVRIKLKKQE